MTSGMENDEFLYQLIEGVPEGGILTQLKSIYSEVFEDADLHFFEKRLIEQKDLCIVVANKEGKLVGFKIGYRYNDTTFYSWVGGVKEVFRQRGIGKRLAELQEDWVRQKGYVKLRTKSMNRFKPMMILNLKNGFNIISVYTNEKHQTKIIFEKIL